MDWQEEQDDMMRSAQALGLILLTTVFTLVVVGSIIAVGVTHNGAWYALPFGFGGGVAFLRGALRPSLSAVCAGFLLLVAGLSIAGVL